MTETPAARSFDLEDRTFEFARRCRSFAKGLPVAVGNQEDGRQLIRASGSVGANYIEANEAASKKDFVYRARVSRKEAKEVRYWLRLLDCGQAAAINAERDALVQESTELLRILSAIIEKSSR